MAIAHVVMDQKQPDKVDNQGGASYREVLGKRDFDKMGVDEIAEAKRVIKNMPLPVAERPTRRYKLNRRGVVIDAQASIRASLRGGGDIMQLRFRRRRWRPSTVVMICDISGSMSRYSRLLLHFAHASSALALQILLGISGSLTPMWLLKMRLRRLMIGLVVRGLVLPCIVSTMNGPDGYLGRGRQLF